MIIAIDMVVGLERSDFGVLIRHKIFNGLSTIAYCFWCCIDGTNQRAQANKGDNKEENAEHHDEEGLVAKGST